MAQAGRGTTGRGRPAATPPARPVATRSAAPTPPASRPTPTATRSNGPGYVKTDVRAVKRDTGAGNLLPNEYLLTEGNHQLRFLPPKKRWLGGSQGTYYFPYFVHYNVGVKGGIVCPTATWSEKGCPICALSKKMYEAAKSEMYDPSKQPANSGLGSIYRSAAYIACAVDMRNPNQGVKLVRLTKTSKEAIAAVFIPEDNTDGLDPVDPTDPETGGGILLQVTKEAKGRKYHAGLIRGGVPVPFKAWPARLVDLEEFVRTQMTPSMEELRDLMIENSMQTDDYVDDGDGGPAGLETGETGAVGETAAAAAAVPAAETLETTTGVYFCTDCEEEHEENTKIYTKHLEFAQVEDAADAGAAPVAVGAAAGEYFCSECEEVHLTGEKFFEKHKKFAE